MRNAGAHMFIRPSLVKTQIKKNKNGRRVLMRRLGFIELLNLVNRTYNEFCDGKCVDKIFQENSVAKCHTNDFSILLMNRFLKEFCETVNFEDTAQIKMLTGFSKLLSNTVDLGFVYFIKVGDRVKIGRSTVFLKRIKSYKSHIGYTPKVLKLIFVANHSVFEQNMIKRLSSLGQTNEWFDEKHTGLIFSLFE